jgi:hypothetical protein
MTNAEMNKKVEDLRKNVSDKEKRMLEFMSEAEQQAYFETKARMQDYEAKLKKKRDAAVKKQKAEYDFWKQVRERKDEVLQFLAEPTAGAESSEVEDDIPDIEDDETQETVSMANSQYQNGYGNR